MRKLEIRDVVRYQVADLSRRIRDLKDKAEEAEKRTIYRHSGDSGDSEEVTRRQLERMTGRIEADWEAVDRYGHINPNNADWKVYKGYKREATLWIATLQAVKATRDGKLTERLKKSFPNCSMSTDYLRSIAVRRLQKIGEQLAEGRKGFSHVVASLQDKPEEEALAVPQQEAWHA